MKGINFKDSFFAQYLQVIMNLIREGKDLGSINRQVKLEILEGAIVHDLDLYMEMLREGVLIDQSIKDRLLYEYVKLGNLENIMELCLMHGANINARHKTLGETCLHVVKSEDVARFLLLHNANLNSKNFFYEETPIKYASSVEIVRLYLQNGANIIASTMSQRVSNIHLNSVLEEDFSKRLDDPSWKLEQSVKDQLLIEATKKDDLSYVRSCLRVGAKPFARDNIIFPGYTALHYVKSVEIAEELILYRADVNAQGNHKNTPLHFITCPLIIELLKKHGANLNAQNVYGKAPLHNALSEERDLALLVHGSDPHLKDNMNIMPYYRLGEIAKSFVDDLEKTRKTLLSSSENTNNTHVERLLRKKETQEKKEFNFCK